MKTRFPWGRMILGTLAIVLLGTAATWYLEARQMRARNEAAVIAEPIRLTVDLSKPGEYQGAFHQTFTLAHAETLNVETAAGYPSVEAALAAVEGISGRVEIVDPVTAEVVWESDLSSDCFDVWTRWEDVPPTFAPAVIFYPFPNGIYQLDLRIDQGAPALNGTAQQLVARYQLCGVEAVAVQIAQILAIVAFVLACGFVCWILVISYQNRCQSQPLDTDI